MMNGLSAALLIASSSSILIKIDSGWIQGVQSGKLAVFKGIPYAAPPLGQLRWREPQPVHPWSVTRLAGVFAPAAIQMGVSMPGETPPASSEDCLYLNVWAPAKRSGAPFPVMVWIHGGGFVSGSASMPLYWGDQLARKGIILVTFAYRLGPLGFLALPELDKESAHHTSGNYGILDQIAALKWVQQNIAFFRWGSGKGHCGRSICRRDFNLYINEFALGQRAISPSDRSKRWPV